MAYIYKIENLINHKVYIGKTLYSIEKRWLEHLKDSQGSKNENRPLYKAMKKYGCSNFFIEELEKCSAEESSDKERFWISVYDSYYNGYNATLGGDGKQYADYDLIHKLYVEGYKYEEITNFTGYDRLTIATALDNYGIFKEERAKQRRLENVKKQLVQIRKLVKFQKFYHPLLKQIENTVLASTLLKYAMENENLLVDMVGNMYDGIVE